MIKVLFQVFKRLLRSVIGENPYQPDFGSMTTEFSDFIVAGKLLSNPEKWYDKKDIEKFERRFCRWNNSSHAYTFNGGRVALSACIYALNLKKGDYVMMPGYTCVVVPNAFKFEGINIIYYDIELDTYGPDFTDIKSKFNDKVKAILVHHLYGLVCRDLLKILNWAKNNQIPIIEDCAHSMGASINEKKVGNFGDVAFFSTEQSKSISTVIGGLAVTNMPEYANRIKAFQSKLPFPSTEKVERILRTFRYYYLTKKSRKKVILLPLFRYINKKNLIISTSKSELNFEQPSDYFERMSSAQAKIGLRQLDKLNYYNQKRRANALLWRDYLMSKGFKLPKELSESQSVYLRYPVTTDPEIKKAYKLVNHMNRLFPVGIWFKTKLHPANDEEVINCPNSHIAVKSCINYPTLWN